MEIKRLCDSKPQLPPPEFELRLSGVELYMLKEALALSTRSSSFSSDGRQVLSYLSADIRAQTPNTTTTAIASYVAARQAQC